MNNQYEYEVGVICLTFNHVRYIERCLSSLVAQETSFPIRIIVHDDASTDGTSDIVRRYAMQYPDRIFPIMQDENIYSKGISFTAYTNPLLKDCKYVALCEGDDWWTSSKKLQIQYDYMECHPGCSLCVHRVELIDDISRRRVGVTPGRKASGEFSLDQIIAGGGGLFGTNSMFYRTKNLEMPSEYANWGVGDYPRAIWLSTQGKVHCISQIMSAYRVNVSESWSSRIKCDLAAARTANNRVIAGLEAVDERLEFKHHAAIEQAILRKNDDLTITKINCGFVGEGALVKPSDISDLAGLLSRQSMRGKIATLVKLYLPFINSIRLRVRRE